METVNKYSRGKIYKIVPKVGIECDPGDVYYGSTCELLSRRIACHRANYKAWLQKKRHYTTVYSIFENIKLKIARLC